jgi:hypothetical protein
VRLNGHRGSGEDDEMGADSRDDDDDEAGEDGRDDDDD